MTALRHSYFANSKVVSGVDVQAGDLIIVGYTSTNNYNSAWTLGDTVNTYSSSPIHIESSNAACTLYANYAIAATTNSNLSITIVDSTSNTPGTWVLVVSDPFGTLVSVLRGSSTLSETSRGTTHVGNAVTSATAGDFIFSLWNNHDNGGTIADSVMAIANSNYTNQNGASLYLVAPSTASFTDTVTTGATSTYEANITLVFKPAASTYQPYWMMALLDSA